MKGASCLRYVGTAFVKKLLCQLKGGIMRATSLIFGIVLMTLLSVKAHAVMQEPGKFIPAECGAQNLKDTAYLIDIDHICFGKITLSQAEDATVSAVQFRLTSGKVLTYKIVGSAVVSGAFSVPGVDLLNLTLQGERGDIVKMTVERASDGLIRAAQGQLDVIRYQVQDFEQIYNATDVLDEAGFAPSDYQNL